MLGLVHCASPFKYLYFHYILIAFFIYFPTSFVKENGFFSLAAVPLGTEFESAGDVSKHEWSVTALKYLPTSTTRSPGPNIHYRLK